MAKGRSPSLSVSFLQSYLLCPRKSFYDRSLGVPGKTNYPRLCGVGVHRHIQQMYQQPKNRRPFYFTSLETAISAWFSRWQRAVQQATKENQLILPNSTDKDKFGGLGANCISNYWRANVGRARPLLVEKRYRHPLGNGLVLAGAIDQLRSMPITQIAKHRPELLHEGKLIEGFDPVGIVDLKTSFPSYDASDFSEDPTLFEKIRLQYDLHEGLAATVYTWLYFKTTGKLPVGFFWYHLRSGKAFFTYRGERDFLTLFDVIDHVVDNLNAQSFPKHVGRHCQWCDYLEPCREERGFLVSVPSEVTGDFDTARLVPTEATKGPAKQLRLRGLKAPRREHPLPSIAPTGQHRIVPSEPPWRTGAEEEL